MPGPHYFAWVDAGIAFDPVVHGVEDEQIFAIELSHAEGGFPSLTIDLVNPRVGLLAAGRNVWAWLSWDPGTGVIPLFNGRLVGVPDQLTDEVVRLLFIARPEDYDAQKAALAETLKTAPFWDPVWIVDEANNPDTILEARSALWHIDRTSLALSVSDVTTGEDGVIEVSEAEHAYDGLTVSYAASPLRQIQVSATVTWTQTSDGAVDLTRQLYNAFRVSGSPAPYPMVASLTGQGLLGSWPAPFDKIGGGWSMAASAAIDPAAWLRLPALQVTYTDKSDSGIEGIQTDPSGMKRKFWTGWKNWKVGFPLNAYRVRFHVAYAAERQWTETVNFVLEADVQPIITEPGTAEQDTISLSSDFIWQSVDPGGAIPLRDLRLNSYFKSDRGQQSFEYLLALARAKLVFRARAVVLTFLTSWGIGTQLSCRHSVRLLDRRLPGGEATGKITNYVLTMNPESGASASVTIGCTCGHGGSVVGEAGVNAYVDTGYVADEVYQTQTGGSSLLVSGDLTYENFEDFVVVDDGLDLFNMQPERILNSIVISGGVGVQSNAIEAARTKTKPDVLGALKANPTVVMVNLRPVTGGAFATVFDVGVSQLQLPKTVDLEHA